MDLRLPPQTVYPEVWQLHRVPVVLPTVDLPSLVATLSESDWKQWRTRAGIPIGTPYLLGPDFNYDVELNQFFYSVDMLVSRMATRVGYARDLKSFLDFLHIGRNGTTWRDASEGDHRAYLVWRREDSSGPRVAPSTWDREVAAVSRFYGWQMTRGHIPATPIPQRVRRRSRQFGARGSDAGTTAASYSHGARREKIQWLPARSFRQWRDVGLRGYADDGLPNPAFRGRWSDRNAAFANLLVRTGMRLTEQASLSVFEIPDVQARSGYHRFWLPAPVAKGGSARWVYIPTSILRDLHAYADTDRRAVIMRAQRHDRYERAANDYLILDDRKYVSTISTGGRVRLSQLTPEERRRLLVHGRDGLEPSALWLSEDGMPISVSTWKDLFRQANERCAGYGLPQKAHAHMLRHTFAVLTLEQMQRGHIAALAEMNEAQRGHYTRIFGDPLDWVRRRLGHRSVTTTQVYLHALEELEMETRMALTADAWEDPRDARLIANLDPDELGSR
jgi:site-specific recombinase XerD